MKEYVGNRCRWPFSNRDRTKEIRHYCGQVFYQVDRRTGDGKYHLAKRGEIRVENIVFRYRIPDTLGMDNSSQLNGHQMKEFCEGLHIRMAPMAKKNQSTE